MGIVLGFASESARDGMGFHGRWLSSIVDGVFDVGGGENWMIRTTVWHHSEGGLIYG